MTSPFGFDISLVFDFPYDPGMECIRAPWLPSARVSIFLRIDGGKLGTLSAFIMHCIVAGGKWRAKLRLGLRTILEDVGTGEKMSFTRAKEISLYA